MWLAETLTLIIILTLAWLLGYSWHSLPVVGPALSGPGPIADLLQLVFLAAGFVVVHLALAISVLALDWFSSTDEAHEPEPVTRELSLAQSGQDLAPVLAYVALTAIAAWPLSWRLARFDATTAVLAVLLVISAAYARRPFVLRRDWRAALAAIAGRLRPAPSAGTTRKTDTSHGDAPPDEPDAADPAAQPGENQTTPKEPTPMDLGPDWHRAGINEEKEKV